MLIVFGLVVLVFAATAAVARPLSNCSHAHPIAGNFGVCSYDVDHHGRSRGRRLGKTVRPPIAVEKETP
ncbi:UNVERIFIED_ORG: hypothetical protein FNL38_106395 [Nocardia globerula]|jgi:hypothetical protein|uniref:Secreted protein n=1 Tax=Nocardia globerula TaxID=1818 RepID=A0A652YM74_NOCGL|nr:hypothetical protein SZ00_00487 [Rhodococcus sp. AD45]PVX63916.1 hypothetical protein C8E04_1185 [Rhodococcus globerulus]